MAVAPPTSPADHGLTDEQRDFVAAIREFAAKECTPDKLERLTDGGRDAHSEEIARRLADGPDEVHKMVIALREMNRWANDPSLEEYGGPAERSQPPAGVGPGAS